MNPSRYEVGTAKALCDICGRAYKHNRLRMQWDQLLACPRCYDSKHPDLEPIIASKEDPMVYDARPRPTLTYVDVEGLSEWGGVMFDGTNMDTEQVWELMNITWDESSTAELPDLQ